VTDAVVAVATVVTGQTFAIAVCDTCHEVATVFPHVVPRTGVFVVADDNRVSDAASVLAMAIQNVVAGVAGSAVNEICSPLFACFSIAEADSAGGVVDVVEIVSAGPCAFPVHLAVIVRAWVSVVAVVIPCAWRD